ncbi:hypothetical protein RIF29_08022 [Crotalaria pallida]|uniref:Homeobox-leucine zipper protein n=1 Tax=Crotalaria pallida TaxID=3830 RepID=A0AAN9J4R8_CROPI
MIMAGSGGRLFRSSAPDDDDELYHSNITTLFLPNHNQTAPHSLDSTYFLSPSPPPFLSGSRSMVSFKDVQGEKGCNTKRSFFSAYDPDDNGDDDDDYFHHQPEKKRRLSANQVQFLEKSFEVENKLEPERKTKLAKDLGLEPRQVAIWFQNRRARWKTKQLEKDYESLQSSYDTLKANYDNLLKETEKLKVEVANLEEKVLVREKQGGNFEQAESETKGLDESPQKPSIESVSEGEGSKVSVSVGGCKQEDISSAKSDIADSYADGVRSALLEPSDSSYVFEADQSDLSQDEEDNLSKSLFPPQSYIFPKFEGVDYCDPPASSCNFGFTEEDHAFWPWSY